MTRWPCRAPAEAEWLEDDAAQARHPGPGRRTENAHPRRTRFSLDHGGRLLGPRAKGAARLVGGPRRGTPHAGRARGRGPLAGLGGHRRLGPERPGGLGLGHHQLRLLGRHRPRRHADLRDPAAVPPEVAHLDQPRGRGDDALRGGVRAHLPGHPRRPHLGGLLARAGAEPDGSLAELPEPAAVGRLRGQHLRHGVAALLVRRADPRPRDAARPLEDEDQAVDLRRLRARLARLAAALAALRGRLPGAGGPLDAARALGPLDRLDGLRGLAAAGLAHHDLPALLRGRRDLLRLRDGDHADGDLPQGLRPRADHHDAPLRLHGQGHPGHGLDGRLRVRRSSSSSPGTAATRPRCTCS